MAQPGGQQQQQGPREEPGPPSPQLARQGGGHADAPQGEHHRVEVIEAEIAAQQQDLRAAEGGDLLPGQEHQRAPEQVGGPAGGVAEPLQIKGDRR